MKYLNLFIATALFSTFACTQMPKDSISTFQIQLSPEMCKEDTKFESVYEEKIDEINQVRSIKTNSIPKHKTGEFPNSGNPNKISPQKLEYTVTLNPVLANQITMGMGSSFGVLFSGVELDPFTNEFFVGENGINREWNITTLTSTVDLGLDCNNGHVQPNGKYHYHGTPNAYLDELNFDGSEMIKLGYAADGFPIYYKYGIDGDEVKPIESGYRLKQGERPGDGKTAPNGTYDGMYFNDYEYVNDISPLDECNGRWGRTPDSNNEYYYVITDNFPSSPICFSGTPSDDFRIGNPSETNHNVQQGHPQPESLMEQMDKNHDQKLSRNEVQEPLKSDFDRVDTNKDGYISLKELKAGKPPHGRRPR